MTITKGYPALSEKWRSERSETWLYFDHADWNLPGGGESYADCGSLRFRGCLHHEEHHAGLNDSTRVGRVYVEAYRRSCYRSVCPICWDAWCRREAERAVYRISEAHKRLHLGHAIHVIVSVNYEDSQEMSIGMLRSKLYKVLKASNVWGGIAVFHPWRWNRLLKDWYISPHFHVVGFGWVKSVWKLMPRPWIVKNVGIRKTVFGTIYYQLTHCGINKKLHAVTWFGRLAYSKFVIPKWVESPILCPACGRELVNLLYVGAEEPPPEPIKFYDLPTNWLEKPPN